MYNVSDLSIQAWLKQLKNRIFVKKSVMIIERTKSEVILRLPGKISIDELQDMTDWIRYKEIAGKSKAKQADVDTLVRKIKKGRWNRRKALLIK